MDGGARAGAVALEVSLEPAGALGDGEFVVGSGEVVHADVDVAGGGEAAEGEEEEAQLGLGGGEGAVAFEDALGGLEPGHVGVAEDGEAVGPEGDDVVEGAREGLRRLVGQAVDQIDAEGGVAGVAQHREGRAGLLEGLHAVDGELHPRVGVLHAEGGAAAAEVGVGAGLGGGEAAGIDLDAGLGVGREAVAGVDHVAEAADGGGGEEGGAAAAEVELGDGAVRVQVRACEVEFAFQGVQVGVGEVGPAGDDGGAAAEPATRFAEGQVKIERDGTGGVTAVGGQRREQVGRGDRGRELRCGGVGGVARTGAVVFLQQGEIEVGFGRGGRKGFRGGIDGYHAPQASGPEAARRGVPWPGVRVFGLP